MTTGFPPPPSDDSAGGLPSWLHHPALIGVTLLCCYPIGAALVLTSRWSIKAKVLVSGLFGLLFVGSFVAAAASPPPKTTTTTTTAAVPTTPATTAPSTTAATLPPTTAPPTTAPPPTMPPPTEPPTTNAPPPPPPNPPAPAVPRPVAPAPPTTWSTAAPYYANCDAVRAAGKAPLRAGQPGYRAALDRDGDGVACE
jgi:hypothetical protein